jgi:hypothetical protein
VVYFDLAAEGGFPLPSRPPCIKFEFPLSNLSLLARTPVSAQRLRLPLTLCVISTLIGLLFANGCATPKGLKWGSFANRSGEQKFADDGDDAMARPGSAGKLAKGKDADGKELDRKQAVATDGRSGKAGPSSDADAQQSKNTGGRDADAKVTASKSPAGDADSSQAHSSKSDSPQRTADASPATSGQGSASPKLAATGSKPTVLPAGSAAVEDNPFASSTAAASFDSPKTNGPGPNGNGVPDDLKRPDIVPQPVADTSSKPGGSTAASGLTPDVLALIDEELRDASPVEREQWYAQLKRVDAHLIPDILRMRRLSLQVATEDDPAATARHGVAIDPGMPLNRRNSGAAGDPFSSTAAGERSASVEPTPSHGADPWTGHVTDRRNGWGHAAPPGPQAVRDVGRSGMGRTSPWADRTAASPYSWDHSGSPAGLPASDIQPVSGVQFEGETQYPVQTALAEMGADEPGPYADHAVHRVDAGAPGSPIVQLGHQLPAADSGVVIPSGGPVNNTAPSALGPTIGVRRGGFGSTDRAEQLASTNVSASGSALSSNGVSWPEPELRQPKPITPGANPATATNSPASAPSTLPFGAGFVQTVAGLVPSRGGSPTPPTPLAAVDAASIPASWDDATLRAQLIASLEQQVATASPGTTDAAQAEYLKLHISLRMLYLMAGQYERAITAIPQLDAADQEFWQQVFWGLASYLDNEQIPDPKDRASQTIHQLASAIRRLQERVDVQLKNVVFCRQIQYFGNYERFPRDEFRPGQEVLLYAEIEHFKSEPTSDGQYRTLLRSTIEILGPSGDVRKQIEFPATEDFCRNYRRDYFHNYQFVIPDRLPLGPHVLKLTVFDELSGKFSSYSVNFVVK